jgi:S1-C subfamily serine protease
VPLLRDATSDASGRFEITGVPPGEQSLFVAARDHHARLLSGLFVAEGARIEVEVDLTKTEPDETPRIELAGIGVVIATREDELVIGRVVEGGGAAEAGLGEGDAILAVDGVPVTELGFEGSVARLRGPEGSAVVLTIRRTADDGRDATTDVRVVRRRIRA